VCSVGFVASFFSVLFPASVAAAKGAADGEAS
jgi:hypothetical protein